jgi:hypothetical protein
MDAAALFVILVLMVIPAIAFFLWALVDALRTPLRVWEEAEQHQLLWVAVVVFVTLIGPILYLLIARPRLREAGADGGAATAVN